MSGRDKQIVNSLAYYISYRPGTELEQDRLLYLYKHGTELEQDRHHLC